MRNIDHDAAQAFLNRQPFSRGNTTVTLHGGMPVMRLHGNLIAWAEPGSGQIIMTLAGRNTLTTRGRLNALAAECGCGLRVFQRDHVAFVQPVGESPAAIDADQFFTSAGPLTGQREVDAWQQASVIDGALIEEAAH